MQGRHDLSEEVPGVPLTQPWPLTDVVIQISSAGILHDNHNLAAIFKHWRGQAKNVRPPGEGTPLPPGATVSFTASSQIGPPCGMSAPGDRGHRAANKGGRTYEQDWGLLGAANQDMRSVARFRFLRTLQSPRKAEISL